MKVLKILALGLLLNLCYCTNSDSDSNPGQQAEDVIGNSDDWQVSYFWDKDKDETNKFSDYTFRFLESDKMEAERNGSITTGTWRIDNSRSKLIINISAFEPLDELNDDWIIEKLESNSIELRDDNDEHIEALHFKRQ
jgi:hypothetical protein